MRREITLEAALAEVEWKRVKNSRSGKVNWGYYWAIRQSRREKEKSHKLNSLNADGVCGGGIH